MVVIAMRADFYERCAAYPRLRTLVGQQYLVGPMGRTASAARSRSRPRGRAAARGGTGGDDPRRRRRQPAALPLLEHVLLEVWQRRRGAAC